MEMINQVKIIYRIDAAIRETIESRTSGLLEIKAYCYITESRLYNSIKKNHNTSYRKSSSIEAEMTTLDLNFFLINHVVYISFFELPSFSAETCTKKPYSKKI